MMRAFFARVKKRLSGGCGENDLTLWRRGA